MSSIGFEAGDPIELKFNEILHRLEAIESRLPKQRPRRRTKAPTDPRIEKIIRVVAAYYEIEPTHIWGRSERREHIQPRHIAIYLCAELLEYSTSELALRWNKRDRTSLTYAHDRIRDQMTVKEDLRMAVDLLKERCHRALGDKEERLEALR